MFKLKPVLNYLGDDSATLNSRARSRCPSCSPPDVPVIPDAISAPYAVAGHRYIGSDSIDAHRFVVVTGTGSPNYDVWVALFEAGIDGADTPVLLDSYTYTTGNYDYVDVVRYSTTKFIVYFHATTANPLMALVFTIDGSNQITNAAVQTVMTDIDPFNIEIDCARISDTTGVLLWRSLVNDRIAGALVTLDPATDLLTLGAVTYLSDYPGQKFDLEPKSGTTYSFYVYALDTDSGNPAKYRAIEFDMTSGTPVIVGVSDAQTEITGPTCVCICTVPGLNKLVAVRNTSGHTFEHYLIDGATGAVSGHTFSSTTANSVSVYFDAVCALQPDGTIKLKIAIAPDAPGANGPTDVNLYTLAFNGTSFVEESVVAIATDPVNGTISDSCFTTSGMSSTRFGLAVTTHGKDLSVFTVDFGG